MTVSILTTKLYPPPLRADYVRRPRLNTYLASRSMRPLTLVSAPAGFGKTTAVRDWLEMDDVPLVWYQLDHSDSDPARFVTHLLAGIRQHAPEFGIGINDLFRGKMHPTATTVFTELINALADLSHELIVVLDDYHTLDSDYLDEGLRFLLEHQPHHLKLVIITREDPDLPLAKLRAQSAITEVRADQLRFTSDEIASFLGETMGLSLDHQVIRQLDERTEGWIAGLQLAGLSLVGRDDVDSAIRNLRGDNRYIMEYLISEVLDGLDPDLQTFLLKTSILEQLSPSICNALTGRDDSHRMLEQIDSANLFLVPMDNQRQTYRYHHLFAGLLRHQLDARYNQAPINDLHRTASDYHHQHGNRLSAIYHVLEIDDYERAADLLSEYRVRLLQTGEWFTMGRLVRQLPEEIIHQRVDLSVANAWEKLSTAQMNDLMDYLTSIDGRLEDPHLQTEVEILQGYVMLWQNRPRQAIKHSQQALDTLDRDNEFLYSFALNNLGFAYRADNQLEKALEIFQEVHRRFGDKYDIVHLRVTVNAIANIHQMWGDLRQARQVYEAVLEHYISSGFPRRMMGLLYIGLGILDYERNQLERSEKNFQQAFIGWSKSELAKEVMHGHLHLSFVYQAQGRPDKARREMQSATDLGKQISEQVFNLYINAYQARLDLMQGRYTAVEAWATHLPLDIETPVFNDFTEYSYLTLVRWWLKDNKADTLQQVQFILQPMLELADETGRLALKAEASLLHAILARTFGERGLAVDYLITSLTVGTQFMRLYINEGKAIRDLLEVIVAREDLPTALIQHAQDILSAIPQPHDTPQSQPLVEPLTDRELDVLRELSEGKSNREIAEDLYVSVGTVKTHARHIYEKLSVNNRTHAVARARELGII